MSGELDARIRSNRTELESTLDAIEDRLNVPKQFGRLTAKSKAAYRANPVPWIVGAVTAVVAVGGLVVWSILSDD